MWMTTVTQPGIACVVRAVVRFYEYLGPAHNKAVLNMIQYRLHPRDRGITHGRHGCGPGLEACVDSDFRACLDARRSVSGAAFMPANGVITWHSRMQEMTASSTSEAE